MHCTWDGCSDDACDTELDSHVCEYPVGGLPVLQLRGLCKKSKIGRKSSYFSLRRDKVSPSSVYPKKRSLMFCFLDNASLGWCVPWMMRPWPMCPDPATRFNTCWGRPPNPGPNWLEIIFQCNASLALPLRSYLTFPSISLFAPRGASSPKSTSSKECIVHGTDNSGAHCLGTK
jgi:hypothetical protein